MAPRLLRYLVFITLKRFLGSLALLLVIYISIDMVEATSIARSGGVDVLYAYPFKIPSIVTHILPLAAALGALLSYSHLTCAGEWDAMLLVGLSPLRLAAALMIVPLAVTVIGGLTVATALTLIVIPVVYSLLAGERMARTAESPQVAAGGPMRLVQVAVERARVTGGNGS